MIYHICSKEDWIVATRKGFYEPTSLQKEGFIHFSTLIQVLPTANRFYLGQSDLVLLEIDETGRREVRFEPALDLPEERFPHYYGGLATRSISAVYPFSSSIAGRFMIPEELSDEWQKTVIHEVIHASLHAVAPENVINESFAFSNGILRIQGTAFDLSHVRNLHVIALGKASLRMAAAVEELLGSRVKSGLVILKHLDASVQLSKKYKIIQGAHPLPNENSIHAAEAALEITSAAENDDLILFLISGGGSALMTLPEAGIPFDDFVQTSQLLLGSGATIHEFNCIRKHLDQVKGGKLAKSAQPAQIITCILSDVVGNDLNVIASGPTVADPTTFNDCLNILEKYQLTRKIPSSVLNFLELGSSGKKSETLKPGEIDQDKNTVFLIGDNRKAAEAAFVKATQLGLESEIVTNELTGEAKIIGKMLANTLTQSVTFLPHLRIYGGETTVTLSGSGLGGRNLETALAAVFPLKSTHNLTLVTLATDGEDGPTDAAGAIVTGKTYASGRKAGLDCNDFLDRHDSYHYFEAIDSLIKTGPTGTNVNDLNFLFYF